MDFSPSNPVTLVVKAPNQQIADQTIECALGWTVKKLKEHLSAVYPSKPGEKEQKLIYSGKLLQDHLMLKDVLRQFGDETQHTLHLVCSPSSDNLRMRTERQDKHSRSQTSTPTTGEGLRQRHPEVTPVSQPQAYIPQQQSQPTYEDQHAAMWNQYLSQMGQHFQMPTDPSFMAQPAMNYMAYNPQQYLYMQQMYAQYMQQYMQYYPAQDVSAAPGTPQPNIPPQEAARPAGNEQNRPQAAPANQNVRMNAQGGPVDDDDEDEFGQRDWLDWVYTFSRFSVLLSIVYFYSTMSRFMVVFLFFFLVYLYEKGILRWRRAEPEAPAAPAAEQAPVPEGQEAVNEEPNNQQDSTPNNQETSPDSTTETTENTENEAQESVENTDTSGQDTSQTVVETTHPLTVLWSFVSTFFTSLIPQPPPALNAN